MGEAEQLQRDIVAYIEGLDPDEAVAEALHLAAVSGTWLRDVVQDPATDPVVRSFARLATVQVAMLGGCLERIAGALPAKAGHIAHGPDRPMHLCDLLLRMRPGA